MERERERERKEYGEREGIWRERKEYGERERERERNMEKEKGDGERWGGGGGRGRWREKKAGRWGMSCLTLLILFFFFFLIKVRSVHQHLRLTLLLAFGSAPLSVRSFTNLSNPFNVAALGSQSSTTSNKASEHHIQWQLFPAHCSFMITSNKHCSSWRSTQRRSFNTFGDQITHKR